MNRKLDEITEQIRELPGISTKTAERLAISLIEKPNLLNNLEKIIDLSSFLIKDELTGLIIPKDSIANENKDKDILLIVETNNDVKNIISKTNSTKSIFVLDIKNKRDFKNVEKILVRLFNLIQEYKTKEILFLLSPSIESELVMRVIKEEMTNRGISNLPKLTRLSMGIPFGGSIEFSDERTIKEAIKNREKA